jgi:hypothetical protein
MHIPMKRILVFLFVIIFTQSASSQIEDIFDKTKEKIEDEIKKEQKKEEKKEKEKKEKEKAEKKKLEEMQKDTACVSDFHRTHKGEIRFASSQDIDMKNDIGFTETFGEKDIITACVYMDRRIQSYELAKGGANSFKKYFVKCFIDDAEYNPRFNEMLNIQETAFSLRLQGSMGILSNASGYGNTIGKLTPGSHRVRIEIWAGNPDNATNGAIAKGEYTFIKDEPPPKVLYKFSSIPAGMNNSRLEQDAIDAINRYAEANQWKERYYKAVITSYDWYIDRNQYTGIILGRSLEVTLLGSWPDGTCRYAEFSVYQQYDGVKYSGVMVYNGIGSMYDCECE